MRLIIPLVRSTVDDSLPFSTTVRASSTACLPIIVTVRKGFERLTLVSRHPSAPEASLHGASGDMS